MKESTYWHIAWGNLIDQVQALDNHKLESRRKKENFFFDGNDLNPRVKKSLEGKWEESALVRIFVKGWGSGFPSAAFPSFTSSVALEFPDLLCFPLPSCFSVADESTRAFFFDFKSAAEITRFFFRLFSATSSNGSLTWKMKKSGSEDIREGTRAQ